MRFFIPGEDFYDFGAFAEMTSRYSLATNTEIPLDAFMAVIYCKKNSKWNSQVGEVIGIRGRLYKLLGLVPLKNRPHERIGAILIRK